MYKLLSKIGNILFHRLGIVAVLIIAQLILYFVLLALLREISPVIGLILVALSAFLVLWIVGSKSNPGYKIGWIIIVMVLMPFGPLAYALLGGNRLSSFNQRRLRTMERKIHRNLGNECGRSASLGELAGEDAARMAH